MNQQFRYRSSMLERYRLSALALSPLRELGQLNESALVLALA
jgi:hypothetical protein